MTDTNASRPTEQRRKHFEAAASWAADVDGGLRASRRIAWGIAGAAAAIAVLEAVALAGLAPLKTVVPYTILVDRQTGYVETVKGLKPGPLSESAAVTQSFLVQYVIARETFDATDLRNNYQKISLWSAGRARLAYQQDIQKTNPSSPLNLYTASTVVSTTIKSVSMLSSGAALVRFETARRDGGGGSARQGDWTAVIAYRYSGAPMRTEDRFLNPLGFQVTSYRRDSDIAAGASLDYGAPRP